MNDRDRLAADLDHALAAWDSSEGPMAEYLADRIIDGENE